MGEVYRPEMASYVAQVRSREHDGDAAGVEPWPHFDSQECDCGQSEMSRPLARLTDSHQS